MIDIVMPQMGESLAEGTVVRWLKKPGDRVERDEPLFEISTDKVDTDVPSPRAGTLRAIVVAEGQTVAVGARVAVIDEEAGAPDAVDDGSKRTVDDGSKRTVDDGSRRTRPASDVEEPAGHFKSSHAPQLVSFRRAPGQPQQTRPAERTFSPAVLDSARRGGVSLQALTSLSGSGRGGRVTKADVARFLESPAARLSPVHEAGAGPAAAGSVPREYLYRPTAADEVVPMSPVRRKIADHMSWSVRISPHASAFAECDLTTTVARVKREREAFAARVGAPLTYTVLAVAALAATVREFRVFNASVLADAIVVKPQINVGIAVALPDTDELIVPVLKEADGLSIPGIARAVADLSLRARERRLRPEDVQGGTITLTNPGMFGGLTGTPILNQPQVAIVGLGAIVKRAVVLEDDRIAPRAIMTIALTFDHRAVDGMAAFRFLDRLKQRLEAGPDEL